MKLMLLLLTFFVTLSAHAQTIKWSQEIKDVTNEGTSDLIHCDGKHIYIYREILKYASVVSTQSIEVSGFSILKFDYEMNLVKSVDFKIDLKNDERLLQVRYFGDRLVIFTKMNDYGKDYEEIRAQKINIESLDTEGAPVAIIKNQGGFLIEDKSSDSMFYIAQERTTQNEKEETKIIKFDREFKNIGEYNLTLADSFSVFRKFSHYVNSEGTIFMSGEDIYDSEIKKKLEKKLSPKDIYVAKIYGEECLYVIPSNGKIQKYRISKDYQWTESSPFKVNDNGTVIFTTVYTLYDGKRGLLLKPLDGGIILMKFNAQGNLDLHLNNPYPEKLVEDMNVYHGEKNLKKFPFELTIDTLIEKNDKFYYSFTTDDRINNKSSESVIACFDKSGKEVWHALIPKKHKTDVLGWKFSSQIFFNSGKDFKIVFNDMEENLKIDKPVDKELIEFKGKNNSVVVISEINESGEVRRSKWDNEEFKEGNILIRNSKQIVPNQMFICYYNEKREVKKYGLVTF